MVCELCEQDGGAVLWRDDFCRVVRVVEGPDANDHPAFCRVILNQHVREMTDLAAEQRMRLLQVVLATESALREQLSPAKMNLASLGNMTPHLHWHVIPRFEDDRHFPGPVWAAPRREPCAAVRHPVSDALLSQSLRSHLDKEFS